MTNSFSDTKPKISNTENVDFSSIYSINILQTYFDGFSDNGMRTTQIVRFRIQAHVNKILSLSWRNDYKLPRKYRSTSR